MKTDDLRSMLFLILLTVWVGLLACAPAVIHRVWVWGF